MASVVRDPGGRKRILFVEGDARKAIRLGRMEVRHAESIRVKIESLLSAKLSGQPLEKQTAEWLAEIGDALHARLARAGLAKPRTDGTPGEWLEEFMASRGGLKPECLRKLKQTEVKLLGFFGKGKALGEITADDAAR